MSSAPSTNDAAFPLQIQEELLNQVRYWTSQAEMKEKLNQEYDTKINEQERIIDALNKQRRLREESEGISTYLPVKNGRWMRIQWPDY